EILEELRARGSTFRCPPGTASPEFTKWRCDTEAATKNIFKSQAAYINRFTDIVFNTTAYRSATRPGANERMFLGGIKRTQAILQSMIGTVKTYWNEDGTSLNPQGAQALVKVSLPDADPRVVFVV